MLTEDQLKEAKRLVESSHQGCASPDGKMPLVIGVQDTPTDGLTSCPIVILLPVVAAQINLEGIGFVETHAYIMTREQARGFVERITEALAGQSHPTA